MASPSNDTEPESPDDEEEYIEAGFDPLLFWDQYRQAIILAIVVLVVAGVVFGIYQYNQSQRIAAAGAALAQAASEDGYRQVMDKYPGTVAAGDAALLLGGKLRASGKYDDSIQTLQTFLDTYPNHPLAAGGDLGIGEALEAAGKIDDALAKYQEVAAKYPDSYAAPLAVISQANILRQQGKVDEARRLYENFVAQFPDSIFSQEVMTEMHLLRPVAAAAPPATPEQNAITEKVIKALNAAMLSATSHSAAKSPAPAAAPSGAPSAAPSAPPPFTPVIPGGPPQ